MDDDDLTWEFLGGLQRNRNLQQNEATQKEIAGLREDLKRKEQAEAAKKAAEAAAPKCPYCAGTISNGVAKCRHCTSDVQWCEVQRKQYPLKAEEDPKPYIEKKLKELAHKKRLQAHEKQRRELARRSAALHSAQLNKKVKRGPEENVVTQLGWLLLPCVLLCLCILWLLSSMPGQGEAWLFATISMVWVALRLPSAMYAVKASAQARRKPKEKSLFKGAVICPHCNAKMRVTPSPKDRMAECANSNCSKSFVVSASP